MCVSIFNYGGWMLDITHVVSYQTAKPYMRNVSKCNKCSGWRLQIHMVSGYHDGDLMEIS